MEHTSRGADSKSPARRCSGALLLLAIASLLIACGGPSPSDNGTTGSTTSSTPALVWDPVNAPGLQGYRVYYGTAPGTYLQPLGQGLSTVSTTYQMLGLSSQTTYYFVVTAYDAQNESAYSNEVSSTIP